MKSVVADGYTGVRGYNMSKTIFWSASFILIFATSIFASQISRITLSELYVKSDLIVMAEVVKLVKKGNQDHVTIKTDLYMKGKSSQRVYTFNLVTRGGLKDFDPSLKKGDTGVFFLILREQEGQVEKTYWGSVATFQKNNFYSTAMTPSALLDAWRSHRLKHRQIHDIESYERGFRKGLTDPPGLVDGSADFNLGHSDGMISKNEEIPQLKDASDSE